MKYMLMMNVPWGANGDYQLGEWPKEDLKAHMDFQNRLDKELKEAGELVLGEGLTPPIQAKLVRANKSGAPVVTDGPFAEAKEFLVGFWIIDVDTPQRAYEIAARASAAPGPGGKPLNLIIEVRPVMGGPPPMDA